MPVLECPICHQRITVAKVEEAPYRPFCSKQCKLIDLGRWLNGEYRVSEEIDPTELPPEDPARE